MANGGKAQQLREGKGRMICQGEKKKKCCGEAAGRTGGGSMKRRREARYLLPCLSESKRCQKVEKKAGWGSDRDKEGKQGRKQELVIVIKDQKKRLVKWLESSLHRGPVERRTPRNLQLSCFVR